MDRVTEEFEITNIYKTKFGTTSQTLAVFRAVSTDKGVVHEVSVDNRATWHPCYESIYLFAKKKI